jgi:hypothetical protein
VPAWQARRAAEQTRSLPVAGARWVDEQLAARTRGWGTVTLDRVVALAVARFDPVEQARREDQGKASWDVQVRHPRPAEFAGTSELSGRADSLDLKLFYALVCEIAANLAASGDTDPLGARKAKALGVIVALLTGRQPLGQTAGLDREDLEKVRPTKAGGKVKAYVRVGAEDLDTSSDPAVGEVERLGAATIALLKTWVGHSRVTIQPVLNMGRTDAVDGHDPPAWMEELVILRDGHCVFPGCAIDARSCDLDHIVAYVDPDEGGPPGQTRPENLACLCRRHHRAKTARRWRYARTPEGHHEWTSPRGKRYLVTPTGTATLAGRLRR